MKNTLRAWLSQNITPEQIYNTALEELQAMQKEQAAKKELKDARVKLANCMEEYIKALSPSANITIGKDALESLVQVEDSLKELINKNYHYSEKTQTNIKDGKATIKKTINDNGKKSESEEEVEVDNAIKEWVRKLWI